MKEARHRIQPFDNMNGYKLLAPIYRQIANHRRYFAKQVSLLENIFDLLGIQSDCKILDAACGTGDVAASLYRRGYNIFASDGSEDMLAQWKSDAPPIKRMNCDWAVIDVVFFDFGTFDLVFMLCNSIAHASLETVQNKLLKNVFTGLNEQGWFVFDVRAWQRDSAGKIYEAGRPIDVERMLQKVNLPDGQYWLIDKVKIDYGHAYQSVEYVLSKCNEPQHKYPAEIRYSLFDWKDASEWLNDAGFRRDSIHVFKFPDWDYLIISGSKNL